MTLWLLTLGTVLFILTGFGITEFRIVETITFGLLTKPIAFKIHNNLWIPFVVLVSLHAFFLPRMKMYLKSRKNKPSSSQ